MMHFKVRIKFREFDYLVYAPGVGVYGSYDTFPKAYAAAINFYGYCENATL